MKYQRNNKFITDPIHGEIEFNHNEQWLYELINTPEFKRLQKINQLGECDKVFYSALHNRLSHSIGVFYICKQFLKHFNAKISASDCNAILAAALLHDVGHGPKSHSFEFYTNHNHEEMTKLIITSKKTQINQVLTKYKIDVNKIIDILSHRNVPPFYYQIITSQIDADRLDYLMRDSYFVGTKIGTIDVGVLINWTMLIDNHIVFNEKAVNLLESILFARYQMFKQIYLNKKTLCYECLVKKMLLRAKDLYKQKFKFKDEHALYYLLNPFFCDKPYDLDTFLLLDDELFNLILKSFLNENDKILNTLAKSYFYKNEFSCDEINIKNIKTKNTNYFYDKIIYNKKIYDFDTDQIMILNTKKQKLEDAAKYWGMISKDNNKISVKTIFYKK